MADHRNERILKDIQSEKLNAGICDTGKPGSWRAPDGTDEAVRYIRTISRNRLIRFFRGPSRISCIINLAGSTGTGKDLTAALIGERTGRDVFRIDLSQVVSKYIGETEKNLAKLFDRAENKDWILFFDEADALFGKRTSAREWDERDEQSDGKLFLELMALFKSYPGVLILGTRDTWVEFSRAGLVFNFVINVD